MNRSWIESTISLSMDRILHSRIWDSSGPPSLYLFCIFNGEHELPARAFVPTAALTWRRRGRQAANMVLIPAYLTASHLQRCLAYRRAQQQRVCTDIFMPVRATTFCAMPLCFTYCQPAQRVSSPPYAKRRVADANLLVFSCMPALQRGSQTTPSPL